MNDYILLVHDDVPAHASDVSGAAWPDYFARLASSGQFEGGSTIGAGLCLRKQGPAPMTLSKLTGYIRIRAESLEAAAKLVEGHPDFEAGGTIEIRELPRD